MVFVADVNDKQTMKTTIVAMTINLIMIIFIESRGTSIATNYH